MKSVELGDIIVHKVYEKILVLSHPRFATVAKGFKVVCFIGMRHSNGSIEYFVLAEKFISFIGMAS